jgi:hypothetical protein
MNPIIQQLAEETVKAVQHNEFGVCDMNKYNQKFADLLVRECIKVMYDNAIERQVPPDIEKTPTHYAVAILEHFGVTNENI